MPTRVRVLVAITLGLFAVENASAVASAPPGYIALFARKMTCRSARRNYNRVRYNEEGRPVRRGYRCREIDSGYEYSDVRCAKRGRPKVAFRWQTGA